MRYKLIAFNARFIHSCLALFYVRTALEDNLPGCRPEIKQFTINDPYYPTLRNIGSGEPAALFFSVYIWSSNYIQRLVGDLARLLPDTPIILGGPQAGALTRGLDPEASRLCTLVEGEIEGVDKSFYQELSDNNLQGKYKSSKVSNFKSPYRPDDFAGLLANRHIYYESSRGCPYACAYCLSASERGVRHLPDSQVYAEIENILACRPKILRFVDRTFNALPERALNIWRFLAGQPGETLFHFEMAPDRFTEEMFEFLEQVGPGRFQFELGIQSTNPQTLEAINRKCDLEKLGPNILKLISLDNIHIHLDLILGLPHENRESFLRSFRDVFNFGPHYLQMGLLKVLPGTPISKAVEDYAMVVCKSPPYEILANMWIGAVEMEELFWFGECVEAFFNNRFFRSFWDYLRQTREDIAAFFAGLSALCHDKGFWGRASTQELMSSLLLELIAGSPDQELLRELLIFDWLRSGHRYLPSHFEHEPLSHYKKILWDNMPLNHEGLYDYRSRDEFFKQGVFAQFSGHLLKVTGLSGDGQPSYVCFQSTRESSVFKHSRVLLIPGESKINSPDQSSWHKK